jgi:hypothetical protein
MFGSTYININMQAYLPDEKQHIVSELTHRNELTFVYGESGLLSTASVPPNVKYIFPVSKNRVLNESISEQARAFAQK